MFSIWLLTILAIGYLALLFAVGFWGDRFHRAGAQRPVIYSLALGIHCTSWAFFGTTAQSATYGWAFTPTYMGSILLFAFGYPLLRRVIHFCQQQNVSSLADFIGTQYNKSHLIAAFVTLLCFVGVMPYTALQLDAVTTSVNLLADGEPQWPGGTSFYVALLMAIFAILFGTRSLSLTEKHPGLMLAIAFGSVVKLLAFILVGVFVCYMMFDGMLDLLGKVQLHEPARQVLASSSAPLVYISHMVLGFCSMFCLPRQFHINYVENNGEQELRTARWLFPLYLLAINLFVLPVALAGKILLPEANTDTYVLALPMLAEEPLVALVAFIGGLSAASSMIIVATLAMGIMIANNLITPLWLKLHFRPHQQQALRPKSLLNIRRLTVLLVIGLAYLYSQYLSQTAPLVNSGIIAMALLAQLAPALLFALYWKQASKTAAILATLAGCSGWVIWLLWPSIKASYYFESTPSDQAMSQGVLLSLGINLICFVLVSLMRGGYRQRLATEVNPQPVTPTIKISSLLAVTQKVLSPAQQQDLKSAIERANNMSYASGQLIQRVERELSAHVGNASARILLSAITEQQHVPLDELVGLVEEASQSYQFNYELLQSSVEHIEQGISVVDRHLKLLAWNQRYIELFDYPAGFVRAGLTVEELLRFNARRGMLGDIGDLDAEVQKRIGYIRQGSSYKYLRTQPDGRVIELQGNPMPGGGFVTTYSDITEYVKTQQALEEAKNTLEHRVAERTEQLQHTNQALEYAKLDAEKANESKTKFLAAASHDLMQPFNAATLFAGMISQKTQHTEVAELARGLQQSLNNAEELLGMLLDMTRLDAGVLRVHRQRFALRDILDPLVAEFRLLAAQKQLELKYCPTSMQVESDKKLLRRVLQNLVSNAIRYTTTGKILIGCRRQQGRIWIQVWDTGPGIAKEQQQEIFNEFHQLQQENKQGLGLGLTIVERISKLLGHPIRLHSELGKGTGFCVALPAYQQNKARTVTVAKSEQPDKTAFLSGHKVLLVDNEPQVLSAMAQLFEQWGAQTFCAASQQQALDVISEPPSLLVMDYHLDHGAIGTELAQVLYQQWRKKVPTILNSANYEESIREQAIEAGFSFLHKPVKAGALKRLIRKLLEI
ncbi:PAS domain-containing hybrid sensor histidine kinase/response regulator [Lacimicrobium alkaliphilum]|uniref:histidine kinase n=1 Tax=Lacimicrobium alkaliphilum TaxID=1526571 RepID=A0A0U3AHZ3_9ALTE|nr:NahK/ErcS family hybrid sensor histidine kinase/response regulator [Lacimicrobium alkaliphilum]ALS98321.1 hybrid sensor histidine kinase/response regulator [Lacimicrobium alkaliphilum]